MSLILDEFLPYRLNRLSEAVSDHIRPVYKDAFGLNRPEWRVLVALAEIGPTTATQVGAHSAQHKTKVSRAVRALELRRWVTRRTDPQDRRSEVVSLTHAGRNAYDRLGEPMRQRESTVLDRMSGVDRQSLDRGLKALERALKLDKRP